VEGIFLLCHVISVPSYRVSGPDLCGLALGGGAASGFPGLGVEVGADAGRRSACSWREAVSVSDDKQAAKAITRESDLAPMSCQGRRYNIFDPHRL
jgi:hypothetical protein